MGILNFFLIVASSLFFTGIIIRTKSIISGRKGPGIFQPMKDIIRLFRKGAVYSKTTSFIFQIAPSIYFASVFMAMMIPFGSQQDLFPLKEILFFLPICWLLENFSILFALWIQAAVLKVWVPAGKHCIPCLQSRLFLF